MLNRSLNIPQIISFSVLINIILFRVYTLRDPAKKFKLEMNSKQLYMTGCAVMHPDINIVVVEGGKTSLFL